MKKRVVTLLLATAIIASLSLSAAAAEPRANQYIPSLTFDGTTANCSITIISVGNPITATLELWHGSTRVARWTDSATSRLIISEECSVTKGESYILKVNGTINGEAFTEASVTGTC